MVLSNASDSADDVVAQILKKGRGFRTIGMLADSEIDVRGSAIAAESEVFHILSSGLTAHDDAVFIGGVSVPGMVSGITGRGRVFTQVIVLVVQLSIVRSKRSAIFRRLTRAVLRVAAAKGARGATTSTETPTASTVSTIRASPIRGLDVGITPTAVVSRRVMLLLPKERIYASNRRKQQRDHPDIYQVRAHRRYGHKPWHSIGTSPYSNFPKMRRRSTRYCSRLCNRNLICKTCSSSRSYRRRSNSLKNRGSSSSRWTYHPALCPSSNNISSRRSRSRNA